MNKNLTDLYIKSSEFIEKIDGKYFITLQFSSDTSKTKAEKTLHVFLDEINKEIFGSRSNKKWKQISVIEKNTYSNSHHIHIIAEDPVNRILNDERKNSFKIKEKIKERWQASGNNTSVKSLHSSALNAPWFKTITDKRGAARYIAKQILKGHMDVIQWDKAEI